MHILIAYSAPPSTLPPHLAYRSQGSQDEYYHDYDIITPTSYPHIRDGIKASVSSDGVLTLRGECDTIGALLKPEAEAAPSGDRTAAGNGSAAAAGDRPLRKLHSSFSRRCMLETCGFKGTPVLSAALLSA